jgi:hypothetical protein
MKKYFLGIVAIVLAVGFSAFKSPKKAHTDKKFESVYWFKVDKNPVIPTDPIDDDDATFLGTTESTSEKPSNAPSCSQSNYQCLVYFTNTNKLDAGLASINGSQDPDGVVTKRNN